MTCNIAISHCIHPPCITKLIQVNLRFDVGKIIALFIRILDPLHLERKLNFFYKVVDLEVALQSCSFFVNWSPKLENILKNLNCYLPLRCPRNRSILMKKLCFDTHCCDHDPTHLDLHIAMVATLFLLHSFVIIITYTLCKNKKQVIKELMW